MARRLNWNKARADTLKGELISSQVQEVSANQDTYYNYKSNIHTEKKLIEQGIWPSGKYQGKKISELSEQYLVYAGKNFKTKHLRYAANNELLRRYHSGEIKLS
jgi:hypothetical protein